MNKDVFEGKWKQIRGEAKVWSSKLTKNDLDFAAGKLDVFAGLLQERYGYTRQLTVKKIDERMSKYGNILKNEAEPAPAKNQKSITHSFEITSK